MKAINVNTAEVRNFNVQALILDVALYLPEWEDLRNYNCPCWVVPAYWATEARWTIINNEPRIFSVKIDGEWFPVYGHASAHRIGEVREPACYPNTRVAKRITTLDLAKEVKRIAEIKTFRKKVTEFPLKWGNLWVCPTWHLHTSTDGGVTYSSIEEWAAAHPEIDLNGRSLESLQIYSFRVSNGKVMR